jgi:hypothetical protein
LWLLPLERLAAGYIPHQCTFSTISLVSTPVIDTAIPSMTDAGAAHGAPFTDRALAAMRPHPRRFGSLAIGMAI